MKKPIQSGIGSADKLVAAGFSLRNYFLSIALQIFQSTAISPLLSITFSRLTFAPETSASKVLRIIAPKLFCESTHPRHVPSVCLVSATELNRAVAGDFNQWAISFVTAL